MVEREKLLELKGVGKRFGGTVALDKVDFDLYPGEVHGLVGENGAGKSTLMKILSGVHTEYEGELYLRGKAVSLHSPKDALAQGIGMIYQELSIIRTLSVAENIFLGDPPKTMLGLVDWKRMYREADKHLKQLGLHLSVQNELGNYTVATQQMIEIASVIFSGADIIIMDEPTSALSHNEIMRLFGFIRTLKIQKKGLVFISHFLEDVLEISDRITVLRNGQKVMTVNAKEVTKEQLTTAMLGKSESAGEEVHAQVLARKPHTERRLEVKNLHKGKNLNGVSFSVAAGEVLGIYGGMGAGKTELAECLFGLNQPDEGQIFLEGKEVKFRKTTEAKRKGIAYVPANRQQTLFPTNEVFKNITISHLPSICPGLVRQNAELETARNQIDKMGVHPADPMRLVSNLSGGNQQKVVLGKWLTVPPKVLVLNDPTRGMDVGAKREVMEIVQKLRDQGVATIILSSEPELLMSYADRVVVLHRGDQVAELPNEELSKEVLLSYS